MANELDIGLNLEPARQKRVSFTDFQKKRRQPQSSPLPDLRDPLGVNRRIQVATAQQRKQEREAQSEQSDLEISLDALSERDMSQDEIREAPEPSSQEQFISSIRDIPVFGELLVGTGDFESERREGGTRLQNVGRSVFADLQEQGLPGFLTEFARRGINPTDQDIEKMIDERRKTLIAEGLDPEQATEAARQRVLGEEQTVPLTEQQESALKFTEGLEKVFGGLEAADIATFGISGVLGDFGRNLLRRLSRLNDADEVARTLRDTTNLDDAIIQSASRDIAATTDQAEIDRVLRDNASRQTEGLAAERSSRVGADAVPQFRDDSGRVIAFDIPRRERPEATRLIDGDRVTTDGVAGVRQERSGLIPHIDTKSLDDLAAEGAEIRRGTLDDIRRLLDDADTPREVTTRRLGDEELVREVDELRTQIEGLEEILREDPARTLTRFVSSKTGRLPEVTGKKGQSQFAQQGDQIAAEAGFESVDDAQRALDAFQANRNRLRELRQARRERASDLAERRRNRRIATSVNATRRQQFRALANRFSLTSGERNRILSRHSRTGNISAMTDNEFARFMREANRAGEELDRKRDLRKIIRADIEQRNLRGVENLQQALGLPKLNDMSVEQLQTLDNVLSQYQIGDRFLGARLQETIRRTDLGQVRTHREVIKKLADQLGVQVEEMSEIPINWRTKFVYDGSLAQKHPYYNIVVSKMHAAIAKGNVQFANFEDQMDTLLNAARKSRKRSVSDRVVPTDKQIFKYLESSDKATVAREMTDEELAAARFLEDEYKKAREHLIQENAMQKYVKDYVTHIRRSGLEAYKEDGFVASFKETFEQYKVDQQTFQILNQKTGEVLPLEKFFRFSMQRTGGLKPSENVGRSSKAYFKSFYRKNALDEVVPEVDAYTKILNPTRETTKKGLEVDPRLQNFLKEYINNKRGRPISFVADPGTPPDVAARGFMAITRLVDLGLSVPNFIAANVGEQGVSYIALGAKGYARGVRRMNSKQGKEIIEKYRGVFGRTPWKEIQDTSRNWPDKAFTLMLSGFHDATVRANKLGILAQLTEQEMRSGVISEDRLAQIVLDLNRWRVMTDTSSLMGQTTFGKMATQYKTWAVPIVAQSARNLRRFSQELRRGRNPFSTREGQELLRETLLLTTVGTTVYHYFDDEPESFMGQITQKAAREALSAVGALEPEMWLQTPRAWQYVQDLESALNALLTGETYKSGDREGTLKGDNQLFRLMTPAPVRQAPEVFGIEGEESGGEGILDGMDIGLELDDAGVDIGEDLGDIELDLEGDDLDLDL